MCHGGEGGWPRVLQGRILGQKRKSDSSVWKFEGATDLLGLDLKRDFCLFGLGFEKSGGPFGSRKLCSISQD
jgi:hypothetical protein